MFWVGICDILSIHFEFLNNQNLEAFQVRSLTVSICSVTVNNFKFIFSLNRKHHVFSEQHCATCKWMKSAMH
jgi:hypothetical protein